MKKLLVILSLLLTVGSLQADKYKSWQRIHDTPLSELKQSFYKIPADFASHVIWGWEGNMDRKTVCADLDTIQKKGFRNVIIEAGYKLPFKYLSDGWFKAVKTAVQEARKRNMKVWIIDEGKYPSGFAGGKFSQERPDLRMQALVQCGKISVKKGESLNDEKVPDNAFSAVAVSHSGEANQTVDIKDGKFSFSAGLDDWDILFMKSDFRTSQTRCVNNPTGGKDENNSLCDYLNPAAVKQFIDWTHEQYKKYLGKDFGSTLLGFRGDEPDFGRLPWTPSIIEAFKAEKNYDPTPWLASFLTPTLTWEEQRVKADYWDVWSRLFAKNFFQQQADWCEANGVGHITHLNHDDEMPGCIRSEGDFFRDLSKVQVPGIDAIWNQIWPGKENDYPKQPSSVAHIYGKPRAFSESFAAYFTTPSIPEAKFVVDYQMVRGINFFEFMFWPSKSTQKTWMSDPGMKELNDYTNRTSYLLAQGKPGARIAVYYPIATLWQGNNQAYKDVVAISHQLMMHQRDFDYINEDAFNEAITLGSGYMENKSGQRYYTLIIPSTDVLTSAAWKTINEFRSRGGKVLFWGRKPANLVEKTYTNPLPINDMKTAAFEPLTDWTSQVEKILPQPELKIVSDKNDSIRYIHRILPDGDLYFLFNESRKPANITVDFDRTGIVQEWNAIEGISKPLKATTQNSMTRLSLELEGWGTKMISIEQTDKLYNVKDFGVRGDGSKETEKLQNAIDTAAKQGGGTLVLPEGNYTSGALFFPRGVNLRIEKNAVLISSTDSADFPVIPTRFEGVERLWHSAFLNFTDNENVQVSGEGTVDGKGLVWKTAPFGKNGRPRLICFTNCTNGRISGLKLRNQASWCLHILYTRGFTVDGVDIKAEDYIPSSDGIDIDSSSDIHVTGVRIAAYDDCISIKSGRDADGRRVARPSENILIEKSRFDFGHGGVAMGSEISGCIRNVTVRSCTMDNENWNPVRFKSQPGRGGIVENITFEDITIEKAVNVFDVEMEWRMVPPLAPAYYPLTQLRNIHFKNILAKSEKAGIFHGFKEAPFGKDVFTFENCRIEAKKGLDIKNAELETKGLTIKQL